ncbi:YybS family protein [Litchfieldia alkalitelluris]|uniref:YybS family protein n=1 Tax=Litchfieldia alkalitelluris TaxID=304268 RepID=UPI0009988A81|nr:YybS family protein [Litchfieldia alkalitelluris]
MNKNRFIVDGAMLLAIYIVMLLASVFLPLLGTIMAFILPIPFIIFASKYDIKKALVFLIAATTLSLLFTSVTGIIFSLIFGVSGLVYGILHQRGKKAIEILLGMTLSYIITFVIFYAIASSLFAFDFSALILESARQSVEMMEGLEMENEAALEQLEESIQNFPYLLPSLFVTTAFFFALISQLLSYPILKRVSKDIEKLPEIRTITIPISILWYYLAVLVLMLFEMEVGTFYYMAVTNLYYILQSLMVIQGLSFIFYLIHAKNLPKFLKIITIILAPFLLSIIRILGIIDLGFQLRNKIKPKS